MPVYVPAEAHAASDDGSSSLTRLRGSRDAPASVSGLLRSSVSRILNYFFRASTIQDRPVPEKASADTPAICPCSSALTELRATCDAHALSSGGFSALPRSG